MNIYDYRVILNSNSFSKLNNLYYKKITQQKILNPPTEKEVDTLINLTNFTRPFAIRVLTSYKNFM